MNVRHTD